MTRGSYNHRFEVNDEVLIVRCKDNKAVGIASNFDTILPEVSVQPWSIETGMWKRKRKLEVEAVEAVFFCGSGSGSGSAKNSTASAST